MCGVIGIHLKNVSRSDIYLVYSIFNQTMIRGKHATGISYVKGGKIENVKLGIPVTEFFKQFSIEDCINEDGGLYLIGHIRYSTSDIRYNQPFSDENLSIVHNGVISQEPVENWKYKTQTANDSELILCSFQRNNHPLVEFPETSMAVCTVNKNKTVSGFRNHARPLWYSLVPNGIVITSTKDIAKRSGIKNTQKCEMFVEYAYNEKLTETIYNHDSSIQDLQ